MEKNSKAQDSSDGEERLIIEEIEDPEEEDIGIYLKEGEFNVEKIIDVKVKNGKKLYFVKWEGYPASQNTWEPAEHLNNISSMIEAFEVERARKISQHQRQQSKKSETLGSKSKDHQAKKHKANVPLQEETIIKKIKVDEKGIDNISEEGVKHVLDSSNSEKASNFKFDLSDEEKVKGDENKAHVKKLRVEAKSQKHLKVSNKEAQQKRPQSVKIRDKIGSFKNKDKPKEILGIKPGKNNEFFFLVEWEKRNDGTKPENSHISNEEFRIYDSSFLLDFYESKIVIFARKQGKSLEILNKKMEKRLEERDESKNSIVDNNHQMIQEEGQCQENLSQEKQADINKTACQQMEGLENRKILYNDQRKEPGQNERTLEEIARELDFQTIEETNGNSLNLNSEEES